MTEKIGNVTLNFNYYQGEDLYCDGDVEDELLEIVKSRKDYDNVIKERVKWALLYHLSDMRSNCIEWIDMDKESQALEIGSGCGAITGCLADKCAKVTCVELSKKRSTINAYKNSEKDNIEILVGNYGDIAKDLGRFDIATLIGVLEYGKLYIKSDDPYIDFLKEIKAHLKPKGRLLLAIENKLGLKYWAGCREDHTGRFFDSIENYPSNLGIMTFGKNELENMLKSAGFTNIEFYYPYPDYKFASVIYSDDYLPKSSELDNNMRNFDRDRLIAFDEKKVYDSLLKEGLFPQFSNSFLVIGGI